MSSAVCFLPMTRLTSGVMKPPRFAGENDVAAGAEGEIGAAGLTGGSGAFEVRGRFPRCRQAQAGQGRAPGVPSP